MDKIYNYILHESHAEDIADVQIENIEKSIMRLKAFPYSASFIEDDFLKGKGYRKLISNNYITFYLVDDTEKQVVIMRILYARQQYQKYL